MMAVIGRLFIQTRTLGPLLTSLALLAASGGTAHAESAPSLAHKGQEFYQHERYQEAADAYRQALERDPTSTILQYDYGTALAQQRQYDAAAQALSQAAQAPGSAVRRDSYYNLGTALANSAQPTTDSAAANSAAPAPASPSGQPGGNPAGGVALPAGGDIKDQVKRLEQSLGAFRETILTDPKDDQAKYNYEVVQEMLRRLKKQQQQQQCPQGQPDKNQQNQNQQNQNQQNQQQKQDQQNKQNQQNQQQQNQQQSQNGQDQQQQQSRQNKGLQQNKPQNGQGQQGQQSPQPGESSNGDPSQPQQQPMTQEQMDALRLLNLLEKDKPEQFKQLFRFQGKRQEREPLKDW